METSDQPKRKYHSTRRQEQAHETRRRILLAALKLFSTYGYAGATIEMIAQEAGVASLTIFSIFTNKRTLLSALVGFSVGGDEQPVMLLNRPGPQAVLKETDPARQITLFAEDISIILERVSPVIEIVRIAAKTEPELAELLHDLLERRFRNLGVFVEHVAANSQLRDGLDFTKATEIVWSIASPEIYRLLTIDRGWSKDRFSQWLGEVLSRLLLP